MASFTEARSAFMESLKENFKDSVRDKVSGNRILQLAMQVRDAKNLDIRALAETLLEVKSVKKQIQSVESTDSELLSQVGHLERILEHQTAVLSKKSDNIAKLLSNNGPAQASRTNTRQGFPAQRTFFARDGRQLTQNLQTGRFEKRRSENEEKSPQVVLLRQLVSIEQKNYELGRKTYLDNQREQRRSKTLANRSKGSGGGGGFGVDDILDLIKGKLPGLGGVAGGVAAGLARLAPGAAIGAAGYGLHRLTQNAQDENAKKFTDREVSPTLKNVDDFVYRYSGGLLGGLYRYAKPGDAKSASQAAPSLPGTPLATNLSSAPTLMPGVTQAPEIVKTESDVLNLLLAMKNVLEDELEKLGIPVSQVGRNRSNQLRAGIGALSNSIVAGRTGTPVFGDVASVFGGGVGSGSGGFGAYSGSGAGTGAILGSRGGAGSTAGGFTPAGMQRKTIQTNAFGENQAPKTLPSEAAGPGTSGGGITNPYGFAGQGTGSFSAGNMGSMAQLPGSVSNSVLMPGSGTQNIGGGSSGLKNAQGTTVSTADTSLPVHQRALLDTISRYESNGKGQGYNTTVGGGSFEGNQHPGNFGGVSTAAGRYQFLKGTWDSTVKDYNKANPSDPITDFSPRNQDRAAYYLAQKDYARRTGRDLDSDLKSGNTDYIQQGLGGQGLNTTWQGFQGKSDIGKTYADALTRNQGYATSGADAAGAKTESSTGAPAPGVETGSVKEAQGQVAATRKFPIQDNLRQQLQFAAEKAGVSVEVFSGGQPGIGEGGARTGSTRHDHGGAGDIKLYETDPTTGQRRMLDMTNPADAAKMEQFSKEAVRAGATGIGAGLGYMGPNSLHIGGGNPAFWGGADFISRAWKQGMDDQKAGKEEFETWKAQKAAMGATATPAGPLYDPSKTFGTAFSTDTVKEDGTQSGIWDNRTAPPNLKDRTLGAQMKAFKSASQEQTTVPGGPTLDSLKPSSDGTYSSYQQFKIKQIEAGTIPAPPGYTRPDAYFLRDTPKSAAPATGLAAAPGQATNFDKKTLEYRSGMGSQYEGKTLEYRNNKLNWVQAPDGSDQKSSWVDPPAKSSWVDPPKKQTVPDTGSYDALGNYQPGSGGSAIPNNNSSSWGNPRMTPSSAFQSGQASGETSPVSDFERVRAAVSNTPSQESMPKPAAPAPVPDTTPTSSQTSDNIPKGNAMDEGNNNKKLSEIEHTINDYGQKSQNTVAYA